jgi:hypothetical protein
MYKILFSCSGATERILFLYFFLVNNTKTKVMQAVVTFFKSVWESIKGHLC